jgi:ABC-type sugar transport system permease subunit
MQRRSFGNRIEPYLYLIPAFFFLVLFFYWPFIKNLAESFFTVNTFHKIKRFAGWKNYANLFKDQLFVKAIGNTLAYVVATVPVSLAIGLGLALLARVKRRLSTVYEALFALSMATSASVIAMIFQLAYNPSMGIINQLFHININWLNDSRTALLSLIIIQIWHNVGYNFIFFLATLRGVQTEVLESAKIDGARGLKLTGKIILPLISPTILFLLVSDIAHAITTASFTLILTGGGPNGNTETIVSYIYNKAVGNANYNAAYAATTIGFIIASALMLLSMIYDKKKVSYD